MHQYTRNLAVLLLALSSALLVTPSFAQTITESNKDNTSNIIPQLQSISATDTTAQSKLSNSGSGDRKSVVVSEADNKASSSANVAAPDPNPRIPIPSRVFAVPSMQQ